MSRLKAGSLPVFWQTLALLLASLLISQAVGIGMVFLLPQPRPDFNRLSDIQLALHGGATEIEERDQALHTRFQQEPPVAPRGLVEQADVDTALAERLKVAPGAVKLFFQPERPFTLFAGRRRGGSGPMRRHEPIFFGRLVAGLQTPTGWQIAETPPPPLIAPWQRRLMLWFAVGALALVPLAWAFARAISRPVRRFAEAADRLGTDPQAPPVAEEGAAELRVAARALNRMQSRVVDYLGERTAMIGAIAHDLRTPLARIAFRAEAAPEPMREKMLADVGQMQAMISATMGFVRHATHAGERVEIALGALVEAIVGQDCELGRDVRLVSLAPATVNADPLALERLIQNLIDNALAYGGAVELSLGREPGAAVLIVADRGPGLPPALLDRVFQPFVRGDPSRNRETGGIGLGLTIARAIADDHGGRLTLANRDGGGLEARLRLPLA